MNPREPRATTLRMVATELESGSDRARTLAGCASVFDFAAWVRNWADDLAPVGGDHDDAHEWDPHQPWDEQRHNIGRIHIVGED